MLLELAASLPDPKSAESLGWLFLGLLGLLGGVDRALAVKKKLREERSPVPGEVTEDRVAALEARVKKMELRMEHHMGEISAKFESIFSTLTNLQTDWSYAIGRIDGRTESQNND